MESQESIDGGRKFLNHYTKAYFNTKIHINLESTDVKFIFSQMIEDILDSQIIFFFKRVVQVGISKK